MEILLTLSGFIFACLVALLYECKIRQMRKELRDKVRLFVTKRTSENYLLYIKDKDRLYYIVQSSFFKKFGLNPDDFADMKEGEIREVFINLED